jgi:UDP-N-acetylglucosamine acyltransferase
VASEDGAVDPALIGRLLPYRYPLLLVDRVVEVEDGVRLVARKSVTVGEPFFAGHFPGRPVMPGVVLCEALVQAAALLAHRSTAGLQHGATLTVVALDRARFRRSVVPGDQLELEVRVLERRSSRWRLRGVARVDGAVAAEADFTTVAHAGGEDGTADAAADGPAIHSTAVVAPGAELAAGVRVGPYAVIGPHVRIGAGTRVGPHAVIDGRTTIGRDNRIFQFASVGAEPQDLKYRGEESRLEIGDRNIIREFATLNPGTTGGGMVTTVGSGTLLMNYAHVGHDCHVGSQCVLANGATLAGHVTIEDYVIVGGLAAIHQFVRIGESAILGGGAMVIRDVPPFCNASGDRARLRGINVIGLKRRGFDAEQVRAIKTAYRLLFASGTPFAEARARVAAELQHHSPEVDRLLAFLAVSSRGITCAIRRGDDEPPDPDED